ncbi:MAG: Nif3-like dinuclear metal center hexameric protein [Ornithinimicrobium sp.]
MQDPPSGVPLRDVIAALERLYPPQTAQSWDHVGLVTGDLDQPIHRILVAVDPTAEVIAQGQEQGCDLIITHHPLLLRGIHSIASSTAKGSALQRLVLGDIALYCAHTNADVAEAGVGHALAAACGLTTTQALSIEEGQELGRVGDLPEPVTLHDFATTLGRALPHTPVGMRISGPPEATVQRIAVLGGAGDSSFDAVVDSGADVYVTADLRHHPASEAREQAALGNGTPYLIDAGHYASEAVWLPVLAEQLIMALGEAGARLDIDISTVCTDPWDFVVGTADEAAAATPTS